MKNSIISDSILVSKYISGDEKSGDDTIADGSGHWAWGIGLRMDRVWFRDDPEYVSGMASRLRHQQTGFRMDTPKRHSMVGSSQVTRDPDAGDSHHHNPGWVVGIHKAHA